MQSIPVTETNPVKEAADKAWLKYANGTFSRTDEYIFMAGFQAGWEARKKSKETSDAADTSNN